MTGQPTIADLSIRYRIGSANAGNPATNEYTDATFSGAVAALTGEHVGIGRYHSASTVHVTAVYTEAWTEISHIGMGRSTEGRKIEHRAGEAVFGLDVEVHGRDTHYSQQRQAQVSWSSGGVMDTDEAAFKVQLMGLAIELAKATNAGPACPACAKLETL